MPKGQGFRAGSGGAKLAIEWIPVGTVVNTVAAGDDARFKAILPAGGTTAQALIKSNNTDFITEWHSLVKGDVGLGNVENTALSTWAGTSNITILGTIATGVWNGTIIGIAYGGTNASSFTANQLLYYDGTRLVGSANVTIAASTGTILCKPQSASDVAFKAQAPSGTAVVYALGLYDSSSNLLGGITIQTSTSNVIIIATNLNLANGLIFTTSGVGRTFAYITGTPWSGAPGSYMHIFGDSTGTNNIGIGAGAFTVRATPGGSTLAQIDSSGNIKCAAAGTGFYAKEGTNCTMGVATLVGGTVTVNTTKVTASSRIFLTVQSLGTVAVPKAVGVTARSAGTSFTITSADATDTSVIAWLIVEPS